MKLLLIALTIELILLTAVFSIGLAVGNQSTDCEVVTRLFN